MKINHKQINAALELPANERYQYFIKVISDWQEAWGLYNDGWALAATDTQVTVFPIRPAKEYAALCAEKEWAGYIPKAIPIEDMLNELFPKLKKDGLLAGVLYTPLDQGITQSIDCLIEDFSEELRKY